MRILIILIFLVSNSYANEAKEIKNLIINKELKKYDSITLIDDKGKLINMSEYKGNLILLNFWATWCAPCKEEMPSLDKLQIHKKMNNLRIFPVNVGRDNLEKSLNFYNELRIKNLKVFFDTDITLAKKFGLRGIPTSILLNKDGLEFARIIGSIDYEDIKFIDWLSNYN
tara:strand:+ start:632 stop:1141 length:510 start_codon:yes stop_codon:yes gene_type:complete